MHLLLKIQPGLKKNPRRYISVVLCKLGQIEMLNVTDSFYFTHIFSEKA